MFRGIAEEAEMTRKSFLAARGSNLACPGRLALWALLGALVLTSGPALAQSFLGTIRGTVLDPQGLPLPGASVIVTDEATGAQRNVQTDGKGDFEVLNLQPGTYKVGMELEGFKKFERTGVVLRAASIARVDGRLDVGQKQETVIVTADAINNITLESQAIARGLDAQQLRDLPRSSRDIQAFLLLNPNVLGGFDDIQFLGSRTYGVAYIQDGQASTNAIFGTVGNSAPGLDAISEMQVLSNSYSAEYGGLAGVIVTTKRGGNAYNGTAFYDFNSDGLNALTYGQKLSGAERGDPLSDTSQHRWGASLGGPLKSGRTFFYANYEGLHDKQITGGGRANVPTDAMRHGNLAGANFTVRDPLTGQPFPGNIIPTNRLDPAALKIMDFYFPLPNQGTLATGFGVFQQYVPQSRNRQRGDLRIDHEASPKDSIFLRGSYQSRDPRGFTYEAGNALTNLPILQDKLTTYSAIAGWTRLVSSTLVNEFRAGYNFDESVRKSNFTAVDQARALGVEAPPSLGADVPGFPSYRFMGGAGSTRPVNIADAARNTNRVQQQNSFSVSNNLSWVTGPHSLRGGVLYTRNKARDGFGRGLNHRGRYDFNGSKTGNAFTDFLLGLPFRVDEHVSTRGDLNGTSNDWAFFLQDDWKVNRNLTLFLGARYELTGAFKESNGLVRDFIAADGGYNIIANESTRASLPPGLRDPSSIFSRSVKTAAELGLPETILKTDKNNISPRVGFAYRIGNDNKSVFRGGFGIFHPTAAVQGFRDQLAANQFRYTIRRVGGTLDHGFSQGVGEPSNEDFGIVGIFPNVQQPDIYQYNLTVERELPGDLGLRLSYIGSTMRKLLVTREYNSVRPSLEPFCNFCPEDNVKRPFPLYGNFMTMTENTGSGQFHAGQIELQRRFKNGFGINVAYTLAHSSSNAPDSGNSSLGVIQYDPYNIEADRGPDPNVVRHRIVMNGTWDIPVGKGRKLGSNMPAWADALFGGWTVSTIFQARSGNNLTPFFTLGYSSFTPYNIGIAADTTGAFRGDTWRPDQLGDPKTGGPRNRWFDPSAYGVPAPGVFPGSTKRNSFQGPGTWVVNLAAYKDIVARSRFKLQFTATLDNAFNHPQFFVSPDSDFLNLTDFLINGDPNNGTMGVLGAEAENNVEGFSFGRVIRFGIRATF
jgi:carboxypeptidase family protein